MPYGTLKADTLTYYTATGDVNLAISGIAISGSPLISGVSGVFTTSVSGATVTGNAGQFTTITGGTAEFTNITGVSGTFTSRISGATVTGTSGQFTTLTATTGVFTTSISGATISGDVGLFTTISGSQGVFNSGLSVPSGTAASPSISFNGDPNTGLYSTGADALALSTNGTGRLFVDASGNVGIGTSTSGGVLRVFGATGKLIIGDSNFNYFDADTQIFRDSSANERMRLDSSGRLGVGTSSPSYLLHLNGSSNVESRAVTSGASSTAQWGAQNTTGATVVMGAGGSSYSPYGALGVSNAYLYTGSDLAIATDGANVIKFATGAGVPERMRLDASGRLGIGTSAPSTLFHCAGTARFGANDATDIELQIGAGATGNRAAYIDFVGDTTYSDYGLRIIRNGTGANTNSLFAHRGTGDLQLNALEAGAIGLFTNDTQRLRITSAGNVGIGTTAVDVKTQIVKNALTKSWSADGDDVLAIENSGTTNVDFRSGSSSSTYLMFSDGDARARGYVAYLHSSDALLLGAANSERARIDSSGRLLVGTSSYSFAATAVLQGNSSASNEDAALRINRGGTPGANADLGLITFGDNAGNIGAAIRATNDTASSWGSGDYPGRLTFSTTADGASSPTERMRISQNGVVTVKNGAVAEIGTLTDGATVTPDFAANCNFTLTISGNRTLANPTNITAGQTGSIFIIQGTGSNTLSWGSYWDFAGGTAPTLSTASGAVDRVDYVVRTSTSIHTVFTANYS